MARTPNPYRPGFNQPPAVLAGRDDVLDAIGEALAVAALDARTPRPLVLTGSRGVGKTVLLREGRDMAATQRSWLGAHVEVHPHRPFLPALVTELDRLRDQYTQAPAGDGRWQLSKTTVKASLAGVGGEAEFTRAPGPDAAGHELTQALAQAAQAALERDAGLVLTVDEVHLAARADLATLAAALQAATERDWPVVAILAGLPGVQDPRRMVTYLERAEWHTLGLLSAPDTLTALTGPAAEAGRPMQEEAAALLARASGGYPYAIQVFGHHTWRAAHGAGTISAAHARDGMAAAERDLAQGLYSSRWHDAAPKERDYLRALAALLAGGGAPTGGDVARALGEPQAAVSYLRERLVRKGTLYFDDARALRFAVPGMAAWVATQPES